MMYAHVSGKSEVKSNASIQTLQCIICKKEYNPSEVEYICPNHEFNGRLDVLYDYEQIKNSWNRTDLLYDKNPTIWRYQPLLPVKTDNPLQYLPIGGSPLYHAKQLGDQLGLKYLFLKCDLFNPTASLKDRASLIAVLKAIQLEKQIITVGSCGNAAASIAALCANTGLQSVVFVPKTATKEKISQMSIYGSTVFLVDGNYDAAYDLSLQASERFGWYSRNSGYNPYLLEGKKTATFEICEQLHWKSPDHVFVPVGDGCIIGSVGKAINELFTLGWIKEKPHVHGVVAEGAAALYNTWKKGDETIKPVAPKTLAESIAVGLPRDGVRALRTVRRSHGEFIAASDELIIKAMQMMAKYAGIFAEPAGAASLAGVISMLDRKKIDNNETVVIIVTGNGLKDVRSAVRCSSSPIKVKPNITVLEEIMRKINHMPKKGVQYETSR